MSGFRPLVTDPAGDTHGHIGELATVGEATAIAATTVRSVVGWDFPDVDPVAVDELAERLAGHGAPYTERDPVSGFTVEVSEAPDEDEEAQP